MLPSVLSALRPGYASTDGAMESEMDSDLEFGPEFKYEFEFGSVTMNFWERY